MNASCVSCSISALRRCRWSTRTDALCSTTRVSPKYSDTPGTNFICATHACSGTSCRARARLSLGRVPAQPRAGRPPPTPRQGCGTQPQQRLLRLDPDRTAKRRWFKSLVIRARSPRFGVIHGSRCVRSCTIVMLPLVVGTWPARHGRDFRQPSCRTCRSPAEF